MMDALDLTLALEEAKKDSRSCDHLIGRFIPFIKSQTSQFINRSVDESVDDEYSIAMLAFHEAILSYDKNKGAFIAYAKKVIYSRLIDFTRKETRYESRRVLDHDEDEASIFNQIESTELKPEEVVSQKSAKEEVLLFQEELKDYGISLTEVADNNPKQERTKTLCIKALDYMKGRKDLLEEMVRTKRIPLSELVKETGLSRKTLERHRKYLLALFLAYTNGFETIREYLDQLGGQA